MAFNFGVKKPFHMKNINMSIADKTRRHTRGAGPKIKINKGLAPSPPRLKF